MILLSLILLFTPIKMGDLNITSPYISYIFHFFKNPNLSLFFFLLQHLCTLPFILLFFPQCTLLPNSSLILQLKSSSSNNQRFQHKSPSPPPNLHIIHVSTLLRFTLWTCFRNMFFGTTYFAYKITILENYFLEHIFKKQNYFRKPILKCICCFWNNHSRK